EKKYDLRKTISPFPQTVPQPAQKPIPHPLTNYIYHLPSPLHTFYNPHKLIHPQNQHNTHPPLPLINPTQITLNNPLHLIPLSPPQKI
ncbi:DALR anticodon-binding domain-containing protein, partial [Bacillus subtilis]|uniref:DALR anticodon-binding domain-containing protein n=1 Tax=Bacillus subtilis TaxID=1423 RepID=UPI002078A46D